MTTRHLIERFGDAGLELVSATAPFVRAVGAESVFQMDIRRRRAHDPRSEHYLVWHGHEDNQALVQGVDRGAHQLVLMIHEPSREFFEPITRWQLEQIRRRRLPESIHFHRENAFIRRVTPDQKRHFLVGRDERQLFMCRLPRACTTVKQAHESLRAPSVKSSRSALDRPIRQGEWFFVAITDEERGELAQSLVRKRVSIGSVIPRAGKPHVADELAVLGVDRVYVRGAVRHVDHKTIHLREWRRVYRNLEVTAPRTTVFGGTWID